MGRPSKSDEFSVIRFVAEFLKEEMQGYGKFFEIGLKIKSLKKDWLFTPSLCYPYPCEGRT
jgi:hypothetical protein